jgi:phytoene/squalene synthetase
MRRLPKKSRVEKTARVRASTAGSVCAPGNRKSMNEAKEDDIERSLELAWPDFSLIRLFLPESQRRPVTALYALQAEIEQSILGVEALEPARIKLAWWGEELARMLQGEPRHPLTRQAADLGVGQLPPEEMLEIVEGVNMRLTRPLYNDSDELMLHCWRNGGVLTQMAARLTGTK